MDAECLKDCERAVKRLEKGEFDCLYRYFYLSLRLTYSVQSLKKMRPRTRLKMKQKRNTGGAIGAASTLINPVLHLKFKLCLPRRVALVEVLDLYTEQNNIRN